MSALAWLAFPLFAVVVATVAVAWVTRPSPKAEMRESARRYERFQAAFANADADPPRQP